MSSLTTSLWGSDRLCPCQPAIASANAVAAAYCIAEKGVDLIRKDHQERLK
ncbi:MAG: hypothetical protein ACYC0C_16040 [Devosia sp.]